MKKKKSSRVWYPERPREEHFVQEGFTECAKYYRNIMSSEKDPVYLTTWKSFVT